jgi:hypothetical protein
VLKRKAWTFDVDTLAFALVLHGMHLVVHLGSPEVHASYQQDSARKACTQLRREHFLDENATRLDFVLQRSMYCLSECSTCFVANVSEECKTLNALGIACSGYACVNVYHYELDTPAVAIHDIEFPDDFGGGDAPRYGDTPKFTSAYDLMVQFVFFASSLQMNSFSTINKISCHLC